MPRSFIAVSTIAEDTPTRGDTMTPGSAGEEGVDSGGRGAPGNGRGRGFPLEAHAAADKAIRTRSALEALDVRNRRVTPTHVL